MQNRFLTVSWSKAFGLGFLARRSGPYNTGAAYINAWIGFIEIQIDSSGRGVAAYNNWGW